MMAEFVRNADGRGGLLMAGVKVQADRGCKGRTLQPPTALPLAPQHPPHLSH